MSPVVKGFAEGFSWGLGLIAVVYLAELFGVLQIVVQMSPR